MFRWTGLIVAVCALSACSPTDSTAPTDAVSESTPSTTTTTVAATNSDFICLTGDLPFVENGLVAAVGEDVGDATQIEAIRGDAFGACERVTVEFFNGSGAPATSIGPTGISVLGFAGIVRISAAPDIVTTAIADTLLEGELVESANVIRDESGALTIDIRGVGGTPLLARGFATTSPATLVVDVTTDNELPQVAGVAASNTAVVVSPVPGPNLYPLIVDGYAAPGLRSITVQIGTEDSTDVDMPINLPGHIDAWQAFRASVEDGPSGSARVFVGTADANGQPVEGASVSVDLP